MTSVFTAFCYLIRYRKTISLFAVMIEIDFSYICALLAKHSTVWIKIRKRAAKRQ